MKETKSSLTLKNLLLGAASATALMGSIHSVQAQEESANKNGVKDTEVIEVTGFRGSLQRAMNTKRMAANVVDAISAEDIGKSADQNIADALQRVTGVAIERDGGEGSVISVRGAGPNLNNITLNGVTLTSTGASNAVNLSQFSSDVLSSIEVVKTPSADHDEGSLGASVILKTFKPLVSKKSRRNFEVQVRNNSFAGSAKDFKLSTALSEKFLDDTLGFSLVASRETQSLREDRYNSTWWRPLTVSDAANLGNVDGAATNIHTGELVTEWDYNGDGVIEDNEKVIRGYANRQNQYSYNLRDRSRDTLTGAIQWRPTDDTDIQLDLTYSNQSTGLDQNYFTNSSPVTANEPENILWDPDTYTFIKWSDSSNESNEVLVVRNHRDVAVTTQENKVASFRVEHFVGDDLSFNFRVGHSESSTEDEFFLRTRFGTPGSARGLGTTSGYDCSDNIELCLQTVTPEFVDEPSNYIFNVFNLRDRGITDVNSSVYFDVDWDVEFGPITKLEAGLKWASREKNNREFTDTLNNGRLDQALAGRTLADFYEGEQSPAGWGEALGFPVDTITDGWPLANTQAALDFVLNSGVEPEVNINLNGTRQIEQDIAALYVKAQFSLLDDDLTGDVGLRYVETKVDALGYSGFQYQTTNFNITAENIEFYGSEEAALAALGVNVSVATPAPVLTTAQNEYSNLLPSLNLNYALNQDMIIRFATSLTIARPPIDDLKPGFSINETAYATLSNGRVGSTHLKPFKSKNLDLSFEWYFNKDSLLSIALFNKDFSDFAEDSSFLGNWVDLRSEFFDSEGNLLDPDQISVEVSPDTVILPLNSSLGACMPNREVNMASTIGDEGCDVVGYQTARNGSGGYVRGLELGFQHGFDYLPGLLSGLGVSTNYTYSDSSTDAEYAEDDNGNQVLIAPEAPLTGTSEHTYNATVFWEKKGNLIRLAYNKRTDYLTNRLGSDGTSEWIEGSDSLDLSASWKVNDTVSFHFQATNLTDTVYRRYNTIREDTLLPSETLVLGEQYTGRTSRLHNVGTTYRLSARLTF